MATPRTRYWKALAGTAQAKAPGNPREWQVGGVPEAPEPGPWREAATDPPPAPPIEVFWLEQPAGMPDGVYMSRVATGAVPSFKAPQLP